jgi:hypothetical protein
VPVAVCADALWELSGKYDVGIDGECNIIINGVAVPRPRCRPAEECARRTLEEYKKKLESPPPPPRRPEEEEHETLMLKYTWLKWWSKDVVMSLLRSDRSALLDVLQRLDRPEVPYAVLTFLGRFELDLSCLIDVYTSADGFCVSFCIKDVGGTRPTTYCYDRGKGWHAAPMPKFLRLKPLEGGGLAEVYAVGGKEVVRVA